MSKLDPSEISERVMSLRNEVIIGDCIDMVPYSAQYDSEVVRLRSLPSVRYFLHLVDAPTLEGQATWRQGYEGRSDDIMWLLRDKSGRICGTNRLYDITSFTAEKGSQIVEPELARILPAALESEVKIIETAFQMFGVDRVIATIRDDNAKVHSMNERFGFLRDADVEIRGVRYVRYLLQRERWNPEPLGAILKHWAKRAYQSERNGDNAGQHGGQG